MPGAFAHLTLVQSASEPRLLRRLNFPFLVTNALGKYVKYAELGAVSPDLPYLAFLHQDGMEWADEMHYRKTDALIKAAIPRIARMTGDDKDKAIAWLFGYTSHVLGDVTIHPVVFMKVGDYATHKTEHRNCEMNQDSFIFQRFNLGGVEVAEYLDSGVAACVTANNGLDDVIADLWEACLADVHPEIYARNKPAPKEWHAGFVDVVDAVEENILFAIARHVAPNAGLIYPRIDDINYEFINGLNTPFGKMDYNDIFDRAIGNVQTGWTWLAKALEGDQSEIGNIRPWNLDTGQVDGETTWDMWRA